MDMAPDPALTPGIGRTVPALQAARWADLASGAAEANAFYTPALLLPALAHLDEREEVRMIEVEDADGRLIGLMPIVSARRHGRLPIGNVANWTHRHCFLGAPLVRRGQEQMAWAGFLARLDAMPGAAHFLHLSGLGAAGANAAALEAVCVAQRRPFVEIQRYDRALLASDLTADAYWETNVRAKKRKELRRLQKRLGEMGTVTHRTLTEGAELPGWCADFLTLEASGWKGAEGTALGQRASDVAFLHESCARAFANGALHMLRIDLDGRAIAMLVNFRHMDGAFSFKIAIDEALGRFSPGVLVEIDNLRAVQGDPDLGWMDSCAAPGHPMIDSLWVERRSIAQYRVALRGSARLRRQAAFAAAGAAERLTALARGRGIKPMKDRA